MLTNRRQSAQSHQRSHGGPSAACNGKAHDPSQGSQTSKYPCTGVGMQTLRAAEAVSLVPGHLLLRCGIRWPPASGTIPKMSGPTPRTGGHSARAAARRKHTVPCRVRGNAALRVRCGGKPRGVVSQWVWVGMEWASSSSILPMRTHIGRERIGKNDRRSNVEVPRQSQHVTAIDSGFEEEAKVRLDSSFLLSRGERNDLARSRRSG